MYLQFLEKQQINLEIKSTLILLQKIRRLCIGH